MKRIALAAGVVGIAIGGVVVTRSDGPGSAIECACSTGRDCEVYERRGPESVRQEWLPAQKMITLAPGAWRGSGCVVKACIETHGPPGYSMPIECGGKPKAAVEPKGIEAKP